MGKQNLRSAEHCIGEALTCRDDGNTEETVGNIVAGRLEGPCYRIRYNTGVEDQGRVTHGLGPRDP